ncbi:hypothetical protein LXA43DRAFT_1061026 [Ganoderma leucocontextum]|nr:hypothetical protein LXA43DRAFT_1061026 [Ganoderma leucocontextum]
MSCRPHRPAKPRSVGMRPGRGPWLNTVRPRYSLLDGTLTVYPATEPPKRRGREAEPCVRRRRPDSGSHRAGFPLLSYALSHRRTLCDAFHNRTQRETGQFFVRKDVPATAHGDSTGSGCAASGSVSPDVAHRSLMLGRARTELRELCYPCGLNGRAAKGRRKPDWEELAAARTVPRLAGRRHFGASSLCSRPQSCSPRLNSPQQTAMRATAGKVDGDTAGSRRPPSPPYAGWHTAVPSCSGFHPSLRTGGGLLRQLVDPALGSLAWHPNVKRILDIASFTRETILRLLLREVVCWQGTRHISRLYAAASVGGVEGDVQQPGRRTPRSLSEWSAELRSRPASWLVPRLAPISPGVWLRETLSRMLSYALRPRGGTAPLKIAISSGTGRTDGRVCAVPMGMGGDRSPARHRTTPPALAQGGSGFQYPPTAGPAAVCDSRFCLVPQTHVWEGAVGPYGEIAAVTVLVLGLNHSVLCAKDAWQRRRRRLLVEKGRRLAVKYKRKYRLRQTGCEELMRDAETEKASGWPLHEYAHNPTLATASSPPPLHLGLEVTSMQLFTDATSVWSDGRRAAFRFALSVSGSRRVNWTGDLQRVLGERRTQQE